MDVGPLVCGPLVLGSHGGSSVLIVLGFLVPKAEVSNRAGFRWITLRDPVLCLCVPPFTL